MNGFVLSFSRFLILLLMVLPFTNAFSEDEFLKPEEAFKLSSVEVKTTAQSAKQLRVTWEIADKYYMYKSKISFYSDNKDIEVGEWQLPQGKIKNDDFFGKLEVFRKSVTATVPITTALSGDLQIMAKSQGCAEAGLCYPPLRQKVSFLLIFYLLNESMNNGCLFESNRIYYNDLLAFTRYVGKDLLKSLEIKAKGRNYNMIIIALIED